MKVLFIFSEYSLHNHLIERYARARPDDEIGIIKVPLLIKGKTRTESARRIFPKASTSFVIDKLVEFLAVSAITLIPKVLPSGEVFRRLHRVAERINAKYRVFENVMDAECLSWIKEFQPDLIITLFHQIIKDPLISIPRLEVLNIHPGILPDFRGIQPYFWELATGSDRGGCSIHYISDEGIDTGNIVAQTFHRLQPGCSVQLNYYLTIRSAAAILPEVVEKLETARLEGKLQDKSSGAYFSWPTAGSYSDLKQRGSSVVSIFQLVQILTGKFDSWMPEEISICTE